MLNGILDFSNPTTALILVFVVIPSGWFLFLRRRNLLLWRRFVTWRNDEPLRTYTRSSAILPQYKRRVWLLRKEVSQTRDEQRSSISFPASWTERMREVFKETGNLKLARSKRRRKGLQKKKAPATKARPAPKVSLVGGKDVEDRQAA